ncbi:MAG: O-antigen ligase family protein [Bacteroidetes Order II. Incertae sedis bacterium]|nr:O-antigen ligase family protein [Bacteroidetes Order II. bacterium]
MKRLNVYLWLILVFDPFISILRQANIYNTAVLVIIYGIVAFFMVAPEAVRTYYGKNDVFLKTLAFGLILGSIVGIKNGSEQDFLRNYLADSFNILKAIMLYSFGMNFSTPLTITKSFKRIIFFSTISCTLATIVLIIGVNTGQIGYLSGPGYTLLLPLSYYANLNNATMAFVLVLIFFSTKRGAILMALGVSLLSLFLGRKYFKKEITKNSLYRNILIGLFAVILVIALALNPRGNVWINKQLNNVITIFDYKVLGFLEVDISNQRQLDRLGSGRITEAESAMNAMKPIDWIIGGGHGFSYYIEDYADSEGIHNVHFTPLSLTTRYGVFVTALIYLNIISLIIRGIYWTWKVQNFNHFKVPLLYVTGAFIYSFTAYSIMNDLLFMFMAGHLSSMLINLKKARLQNQQVSKKLYNTQSTSSFVHV